MAGLTPEEAEATSRTAAEDLLNKTFAQTQAGKTKAALDLLGGPTAYHAASDTPFSIRSMEQAEQIAVGQQVIRNAEAHNLKVEADWDDSLKKVEIKVTPKKQG
ncbi:MAG: hypothetical protein AAB909_02670 [Patescibacteria group bacterium]